MSTRPEVLFPLFADLTTLDGIGPKTAQMLAQMAVERPRDLLFTLPHAAIDRRRRDTVLGAGAGDVVTVEVEVGRHRPPTSPGRPYRIEVRDGSTAWNLVFFHARDTYLNWQLPEGERRVVSGKIELFDGIAQMVHPDHMLRPDQAETIPDFEPIYPLTAGITQKLMLRATDGVLSRVPILAEWIDLI